ncbi:uncharacterized protein BXIN_2283 [Babesia sp. Xinjiang]|uniref:uncharacterized protein n=1 Tax=Babesia sp. Xinjiang TaxID=462227 RepID=UPI000A236569|nr:uncharacterized protein BXIN_2283 [Babesia sp. Xinjiang]ORM40668.1 hypothetical protein BXIN_2283 [Babesia sp. Xinjiang]
MQIASPKKQDSRDIDNEVKLKLTKYMKDISRSLLRAIEAKHNISSAFGSDLTRYGFYQELSFVRSAELQEAKKLFYGAIIKHLRDEVELRGLIKNEPEHDLLRKIKLQLINLDRDMFAMKQQLALYNMVKKRSEGDRTAAHQLDEESTDYQKAVVRRNHAKMVLAIQAMLRHHNIATTRIVKKLRNKKDTIEKAIENTRTDIERYAELLLNMIKKLTNYADVTRPVGENAFIAKTVTEPTVQVTETVLLIKEDAEKDTEEEAEEKVGLPESAVEEAKEEVEESVEQVVEEVAKEVEGSVEKVLEQAAKDEVEEVPEEAMEKTVPVQDQSEPITMEEQPIVEQSAEVLEADGKVVFTDMRSDDYLSTEGESMDETELGSDISDTLVSPERDVENLAPSPTICSISQPIESHISEDTTVPMKNESGTGATDETHVTTHPFTDEDVVNQTDMEAITTHQSTEETEASITNAQMIQSTNDDESSAERQDGASELETVQLSMEASSKVEESQVEVTSEPKGKMVHKRLISISSQPTVDSTSNMDLSDGDMDVLDIVNHVDEVNEDVKVEDEAGADDLPERGDEEVADAVEMELTRDVAEELVADAPQSMTEARDIDANEEAAIEVRDYTQEIGEEEESIGDIVTVPEVAEDSVNRVMKEDTDIPKDDGDTAATEDIVESVEPQPIMLSAPGKSGATQHISETSFTTETPSNEAEEPSYRAVVSSTGEEYVPESGIPQKQEPQIGVDQDIDSVPTFVKESEHIVKEDVISSENPGESLARDKIRGDIEVSSIWADIRTLKADVALLARRLENIDRHLMSYVPYIPLDTSSVADGVQTDVMHPAPSLEKEEMNVQDQETLINTRSAVDSEQLETSNDEEKPVDSQVESPQAEKTELEDEQQLFMGEGEMPLVDKVEVEVIIGTIRLDELNLDKDDGEENEIPEDENAQILRATDQTLGSGADAEREASQNLGDDHESPNVNFDVESQERTSKPTVDSPADIQTGDAAVEESRESEEIGDLGKVSVENEDVTTQPSPYNDENITTQPDGESYPEDKCLPTETQIDSSPLTQAEESSNPSQAFVESPERIHRDLDVTIEITVEPVTIEIDLLADEGFASDENEAIAVTKENVTDEVRESEPCIGENQTNLLSENSKEAENHETIEEAISEDAGLTDRDSSKKMSENLDSATVENSDSSPLTEMPDVIPLPQIKIELTVVDDAGVNEASTDDSAREQNIDATEEGLDAALDKEVSDDLLFLEAYEALLEKAKLDEATLEETINDEKFLRDLEELYTLLNQDGDYLYGESNDEVGASAVNPEVREEIDYDIRASKHHAKPDAFTYSRTIIGEYVPPKMESAENEDSKLMSHLDVKTPTEAAVRGAEALNVGGLRLFFGMFAPLPEVSSSTDYETMQKQHELFKQFQLFLSQPTGNRR